MKTTVSLWLFGKSGMGGYFFNNLITAPVGGLITTDPQ
jgi:hypothetical protein